MKKYLPLTLVAALPLILLLLIFVGNLFTTSLERHVAKLHPHVRKSINTYLSTQPRLKIGDLVEVRNLDNLESSRTLAVSKVTSPRVVLEDYRAQQNPEKMVLESGLQAAVDMTNKYSLRFITQSDPAYEATATWYFLQ